LKLRLDISEEATLLFEARASVLALQTASPFPLASLAPAFPEARPHDGLTHRVEK